MKIGISKTLILFSLTGLFLVSGCKKNNYLSGGSLHEAVTPLNNLDYLRSNSLKLFDTTIQIIEKFDLINEVNSAKTFFAFTDYSIVRTITAKLALKQAVNPSATYTLDSLIKDITVDSVKQYMFAETIELASAKEFKATPYTSLGKTPMGVLKQLQTGAPYTDRTKAPTYLLFFAKVRGALDEPGVIPPVNENDLLAICQTTGIKTSNGNTTLHVLTNNHNFVSF